MYEFVLRFQLPHANPPQDPSVYLDALYEGGCDDALIGVGRPGYIALDITREAESAESAVASAIADVMNVIPGAELIEVCPDLVNLSDLADLVGCTRQNMRKYASGEIRALTAPFPPAHHAGQPPVWRLCQVGPWLNQHTTLTVADEILAVATVAAHKNVELQCRRLGWTLASPAHAS